MKKLAVLLALAFSLGCNRPRQHYDIKQYSSSGLLIGEWDGIDLMGSSADGLDFLDTATGKRAMVSGTLKVTETVVK